MAQKKKAAGAIAPAAPATPANAANKPSGPAWTEAANKQTVLAFLLVFGFLFLPRTPDYLFGAADDAPRHLQRTSADRPEHPFWTPITSDPLAATFWQLSGVLVVIVWWGQWLKSHWQRTITAKANAMDEALDKQNRGRNNIMDVVYGLGVAALASLPIYLVLTLFGAPVKSHHLHTLGLALHLSLLVVYPLVASMGLAQSSAKTPIDSYKLHRLVFELQLENRLERMTIMPSAGAVIGAWIGALPAALDWDRPWQAYPLPLLFMAIIGFIVGSFVAIGRNTGK